MVLLRRYWTIIAFLLLFSSFGQAWLYPTYDYRIPVTWTNPTDQNWRNYIGYLDFNGMPGFFFNNVDTNFNCLKFADKTDLIDLNYSAIDKNYSIRKASFVVKLPPIQTINPSSTYTAYMYFDLNSSSNCGINNNEEGSWNWSDNFTSSLPDYNAYETADFAGSHSLSVGGGALQFSTDAAFAGMMAKAKQLQTNYYTNKYRIRLTKVSSSGSAGEEIMRLVYYNQDQNLFAETDRGDVDGTTISTITTSTANGANLYTGSVTGSKIINYMSLRHTDMLIASAFTLNSDDYRFLFYDDSNKASKGFISDINGNVIPSIGMQVVDEENSNAINSTVTINSFPVASTNGIFDVNTQMYTFPINISVSATGYDPRTFEYDTNNSFSGETTLGLRTDSEANNIAFIFYGPDEETQLTNRYITVLRSGIVSGRGKTNSTGGKTFNLAPQDSAYNFLIKQSGNDTNTQYTYSSVSVSVNQPKDEKTELSITPNLFDMIVGGLGSQTISGAAFPQNVLILGNTDSTYSLRVQDKNGVNYYARYYQAQVKGDVTTLTINPYLIAIADGILVNLKTVDLTTNLTVPDIRIQMKTVIGSAKTIVEDQLTNSAGIAQFTMLSQRNYFLNITSPNQDTNYFDEDQTISPTHTAFTIFINFTDQNNQINFKNFDVNFSPSNQILTGVTHQVDVNLATQVDFERLVIEVMDGNVVATQSVCTTSPCNASFNLTLANFDQNTTLIKAIIETPDYNFTVTKYYFIQAFKTDIEGWLRGLKQSFGVVPLAVLSFLITFAAIMFLGNSQFGNNMPHVFIAVIVFGIFVYLWFIDEPLILIGYLGSVFGSAVLYLWARNRQGA
jgi:hypothetical protein